MNSEISIQDVGAIRSLDIPIAPGTVVVLTGENGAGKSTAIAAVASAVDGTSRGLTPRDGKKAGKVRLPGVTVNIGGRMTSKATGEEVANSYAIVEDGSGIRKILTPGIKDQKAADKKRLEGVLEVIGATLPAEKQKEMMGDLYADFVKQRKPETLGFVDCVKAMKLHLEEAARVHSKHVAENNGAIDQIGEVSDDEILGESSAQINEASKDLAIQIRDAQRDQEKTAALVEKMKATEIVSEPIADIEARIKKAIALRDKSNAEIERLKEVVAESRDLIARNEAKLEAEKTAILNRETIREAMESTKSPEEIAAMIARRDELASRFESAVNAEFRNKQRAEARRQLLNLKSAREQNEARHSEFTKKIQALPTLLHDALRQVPGWTVNEDLQLCVQHERGDETPFSELSPGEGVSRVVLLAFSFAKWEDGEIPIVALPQECFEGLDGRNRELLVEAAKEHKLCVITAEAARDHQEGIVAHVL